MSIGKKVALSVGTAAAVSTVKRKAKKEVKESVGLDNDNDKKKNKIGKKGKRRGKGIL